MNESLIINLENHRSRQRIKEMGEVFTPEKYVQQMLNLFEPKTWSDESVIFFEPTAGHGNIVVPILEKRIQSLEKKYSRQGLRQVELRAMSNAVNSLWAIDICNLNVQLTRKRILSALVSYYCESRIQLSLPKARDFWAHLLCSIVWQITENEALSALHEGNLSKEAAAQTKLGKSWFSKNGCKPIDFSCDWVTFFEDQSSNKSIPAIFLRSLRFFDACLSKPAPNGFEEFDFAKDILWKVSKREHELAGEAS